MDNYMINEYGQPLHPPEWYEQPEPPWWRGDISVAPHKLEQECAEAYDRHCNDLYEYHRRDPYEMPDWYDFREDWYNWHMHKQAVKLYAKYPHYDGDYWRALEASYLGYLLDFWSGDLCSLEDYMPFFNCRYLGGKYHDRNRAA